MPIITVIFGLVLCGLSVATQLMNYFLHGESKLQFGTWLIPAGFGLVFLALGFLSLLKPGARKHAMHTAALLGTIGAILCLGRGLSVLPKVMRDENVNMLAVGMTWAMALVCLTFVGVCVQSFVAARKARQATESNKPTDNSTAT